MSANVTTINQEPITEIGRRPLAVKAFGLTDKGRVRPSNEDQFLVAELTKTMRIWQTSLPEKKAQFGDERGHLFLSPMAGGHRAGEQASQPSRVAIEQPTLNTFKWFFHSSADAQRVHTVSEAPGWRTSASSRRRPNIPN
jgi:hypothetical protein